MAVMREKELAQRWKDVVAADVKNERKLCDHRGQSLQGYKIYYTTRNIYREKVAFPPFLWAL